jgi:hypothetical protein
MVGQKCAVDFKFQSFSTENTKGLSWVGQYNHQGFKVSSLHQIAFGINPTVDVDTLALFQLRSSGNYVEGKKRGCRPGRRAELCGEFQISNFKFQISNFKFQIYNL